MCIYVIITVVTIIIPLGLCSPNYNRVHRNGEGLTGANLVNAMTNCDHWKELTMLIHDIIK